MLHEPALSLQLKYLYYVVFMRQRNINQRPQPVTLGLTDGKARTPCPLPRSLAPTVWRLKKIYSKICFRGVLRLEKIASNQVLVELVSKVIEIEKRYAHEQIGVRNNRREEIKKLINRIASDLTKNGN